MSKRYWMAILRYGHVGKRNEVSVRRYIQTDPEMTILDAYRIVKEMPGVKNQGVFRIEPISHEKFEEGKGRERENFFLQSLMSHRARSRNNGGGRAA